MSRPEQFPAIPKDLIEELEKRFPDHMPPEVVPYNTLLVKQGELRVVRFLRAKFEEQRQ